MKINFCCNLLFSCSQEPIRCICVFSKLIYTVSQHLFFVMIYPVLLKGFKRKIIMSNGNKLNPVWQESWDTNDTIWQLPEVNVSLQKHFSVFESASFESKRIFVPLCGKTVDMKWLYDKGFIVVGVEAIGKAIVEFFEEQKMEYSVQQMEGYKVYFSKDSKLKVFQGNLFDFNADMLGGRFEFFWDRGSLVAMEKEDQQKYVDFMAGVLCTGAIGLLEVMEYESSEPQQPFPLNQKDLNKLFRKDFVQKEIDRYEATFDFVMTLVIYKVQKMGFKGKQ
eukprot:TCONS_00025177-protein